ncbi:S24 family peptidase [Helicobacter winghamensis]|uniref:S24 family peptidase n=1 Tax=Helicobacter winghamensis TaxID=157268 RepID=UPI0027A37B3F
MEMEEIIEKLKDILASEGQTKIKAIDIAKALNIHPDTFNSMKFRNSIPYKQILNFLEQRKININYFFFGSSPKESLECEEKYRILKLYKTNASLGGGGINEFISVEEIPFSITLLEKLKINPKWEIIECKGDSMESLIKDNALCFIDRQATLKDKGIFVVNTNEGLFVKQVILKDKGVVLHSLNLVYQDLFYPNGEYLIVGRVVRVWQGVE